MNQNSSFVPYTYFKKQKGEDINQLYQQTITRPTNPQRVQYSQPYPQSQPQQQQYIQPQPQLIRQPQLIGQSQPQLHRQMQPQVYSHPQSQPMVYRQPVVEHRMHDNAPRQFEKYFKDKRVEEQVNQLKHRKPVDDLLFYFKEIIIYMRQIRQLQQQLKQRNDFKTQMVYYKYFCGFKTNHEIESDSLLDIETFEKAIKEIKVIYSDKNVKLVFQRLNEDFSDEYISVNQFNQLFDQNDSSCDNLDNYELSFETMFILETLLKSWFQMEITLQFIRNKMKDNQVKIMDAVEQVDSKGNGLIETDDLKNILKNKYSDFNFQEADYTNLAQIFDKNYSGKISMHEFQRELSRN